MPSIKPANHDTESLNFVLQRVRSIETDLEVTIASMGAQEIPSLNVKYHESAMSGMKFMEKFAADAKQAVQLWLEDQGKFVAVETKKSRKKKRP